MRVITRRVANQRPTTHAKSLPYAADQNTEDAADQNTEVNMAEIVLEDLGKIYPDGTRAVGQVNMTVRDAEFLVLVGPSGCGKSTVLRMIAGLEDVTEGKISIDDTVVNDVPPKDRDIAMVFQNYALYPHMTVRDNMAFGLKLRKMPKDEIARRVKEAAETLEIVELLDRKPKALSGGQRQRVAMGRAIVREPKAFLMDEPLSNLDAKLRVQMRAELSRLHQRLGTTTVYVTHDQIEAMTLGHRVAVMRPVSAQRPYNLQQVAAPTELFNNPVNLFVAGFIGSPAMNMVYGSVTKDGDGYEATFAGYTISVDRTAIDRHPGIDDYLGREIVIGIRPGAFEDARIARHAPDRTITVTTDVNELLGSESYVHFVIDSRPVLTPDIEELLADSGQDSRSLGDNTKFTARVSPDIAVLDGSSVDLVIDTSKLHFFDPDTSDKIGATTFASGSEADSATI
jgi:multiple sugar transport system ATP-binding protein|tara:strand:- start:173 stop:1537 length:1365 start_codon:yes stop_codon:yes gene_type:complete